MKKLQHVYEFTKIIDRIYIVCIKVAVTGVKKLQRFYSQLSSI